MGSLGQLQVRGRLAPTRDHEDAARLCPNQGSLVRVSGVSRQDNWMLENYADSSTVGRAVFHMVESLMAAGLDFRHVSMNISGKKKEKQTVERLPGHSGSFGIWSPPW